MNASRALWKATEDTLNSLGKSTMRTIVWQMSQRGVDMVPDNFDVNKFAAVLGELLGEGSETVLNMIYRNMCKHLKIEVQTDSGLAALEKINKVLEARKMN